MRYALILAISIMAGFSAQAPAQNPCQFPYADSCHVPDTCCAIAEEDCPWDINGLDVVYLVNWFKGGAPPSFYSKYDVNCNCRINGVDIVRFVAYLKGLAPRPTCCFYQCLNHPRTAILGNRVWLDSDIDGIQDPGEAGVPGTTVYLLDCDNPPSVFDSTVTDDNGHYAFDSLAAWNYRVMFVPPPGFLFVPSNQGGSDSLDSDALPASGTTNCIIVSEGENDQTVDAGLYAPASVGSIGDLVWYDFIVDGLQGAPEWGIPNIGVHLLDCRDSLISYTFTDSTGIFLFADIPSGDYRLLFALPDSLVFSPQTAIDSTRDSDADPQTGLTVCTHIDSGEVDLSWDAGMYTPARAGTIGDLVWRDFDMDGIQGAPEPGVGGIVVRLFDCADSLVAETATDSNGIYLFEDAPSGDYRLGFVLPDSFAFSPPNAGEDSLGDSDPDPMTGLTVCSHLDSGEIDLSWDAGLIASNLPPSDSGCTRTTGYWKNHCGFGPQPDEVSQYLPILLGNPGSNSAALGVTTAQIAYDVFSQHVYGHPSNGITKLYAQELATKLNIAAGADDEDIADVIVAVDWFLGDYMWEDWERLTREQRNALSGWKNALESYNEGDIGPGGCVD